MAEDTNIVRECRVHRRPSDDAFRFFTGGTIELMRLSRADAVRLASDILELAEIALEPKPGFDWTKVRWTGPLAPVDETCSYCGSAIHSRRTRAAAPVECKKLSAVFCYACMKTWWGMAMPDEDPNEDGDESFIDEDEP